MAFSVWGGFAGVLRVVWLVAHNFLTYNSLGESYIWAFCQLYLFFLITGRQAPEPFLGPMFGIVQPCWDLWDAANEEGCARIV